MTSLKEWTGEGSFLTWKQDIPLFVGDQNLLSILNYSLS
mgnify:CR=1 FL=1